MPTLTQGAGNPQFFLRRNAADDDAVAIHQRAQHLVILREVLSFDQQRVGRPQSDFATDRARGSRMIAGHHGHADARAPARGNGIGDARSRRIFDADQSKQRQIDLGGVG